MKKRLEKHTVCTSCFAVGITQNDCVCTYQGNYEVIELEFEVCDCCGHLICDGSPAETKFNDEQFRKLEEIRTQSGR